MAQLCELALQYQRELDSTSGLTRSAAARFAGVALLAAVEASRGTDPEAPEAIRPECRAALVPLILRTTLAASIVGCLERTPWAAVTWEMLGGEGDAFPAALNVDGTLFVWLYQAAMPEGPQPSGPVTALLLRQVRAPPVFKV